MLGVSFFCTKMTKLESRVTEIAYKLHLSHLSAYFTALPLIEHIYEVMEEGDTFVLSQGHAFAALAVVLEKKYGVDAMKLVAKYMTHPFRDPKLYKKEHIDCSTGSLGQGLTVAVGMALADPTKNVYVLTSDGEMTEGCTWEALLIARNLRLENLRITVNANGYSAYNKVDVDDLDTRMQAFYPSLVVRTNMFKFPEWCAGVDGHYQKIDTPERLEEMLKC